MREILFRGKDVETKEWIFGYYSGPFNCFTTHEISNMNHPMCERVEVDPETVGQYIGVCDKNCKPIFEGDLVEAVLPPSISQPSFVWPIMPVVFSEGVFGLQDHRGNVTPFKSFAPSVTFEVKGNVYDQPGL